MTSETNSERRKRKLTELCARHGLDNVAAKSNVNKASLDQVIKGTLLPPKKDGSRAPKSLGDDSARKIEAGMGLGHGWFDLPDVEAAPPPRLVSAVEDAASPAYLPRPSWPFERVDFQRWQSLTEREKGAVEKAINEELDRIEAGRLKANVISK